MRLTALALALLAGQAVAQPVTPGGDRFRNLTVTGRFSAGFVDAGVLSVNAPTAVECVAGFDSPNTGTRAICLDRAGGLGISGSLPYIFWNSGTANAGFANGGGPITLTPETNNGVQTQSRYYSSRGAAACAFEAATEGALYCIGPDTQVREEGTRLRISDGVDGTAGSGTGFTVNATSNLAHRVHKITVTEAALAAAAGTEDETIWTVPAKTRVLRMIADVTATFTGPAITDVDVTCGTSAGGNQYLVSFDVDTATGVYGDAAAEIGAGLLSATVADIPSFSATTAVQCRFTCTGANCSVMTTGSMTIYIESLVFP